MAQDINHRHELKDLESDLLEVIAHHCKGAVMTSRGHSYEYHKMRGEMARTIIEERKIKSNR